MKKNIFAVLMLAGTAAIFQGHAANIEHGGRPFYGFFSLTPEDTQTPQPNNMDLQDKISQIPETTNFFMAYRAK